MEDTDKTPGHQLDPFKWKPGQSGNPAGRPKGSISIKDEVRKYLEAHPLDVQEIVKHFVTENRELMWTMLEGSPKSTSDIKVQLKEPEYNEADLLLAQQLLDRRTTKSIESNGADTKLVGGEA